MQCFAFVIKPLYHSQKQKHNQNEQLELNTLQEGKQKIVGVVDMLRSEDEMFPTTNFHKWAKEKKTQKIVQFHAWIVRCT